MYDKFGATDKQIKKEVSRILSQAKFRYNIN